MHAPPPSAELEDARALLFGLCYRMTGSVSDAEDLVQETFVRAMERPPKDRTAPLRPWLVKVAVNLSRDHLRRRKRREYRGPWLPAPLETLPVEPESPEASPEARYGLAESASYAFLVALEALGPSQRAVLLLRDAFDYSAREAGEILGLSEANVRVTHHRARQAMEAYDGRRTRPDAESRERVAELWNRLVACMIARDADGARRLFAEDAMGLSDGGGVYAAAGKPVLGAARVVKVYVKLSGNLSPRARFEVRLVNGVPALVGEDAEARRPNAPRSISFLDVDPDGKIRGIYTVVAPDKLRGVRTFAELDAAVRTRASGREP